MNDTLPKHDIVLLGAGHTNAHIIRMWRMGAIPEVRLTCVSNRTVATYSGMLPGTLADQYQSSRMEIDLVRLCAACNVRFIHASATRLDVERRLLLLHDRPPVHFDALSIGIGSRPMAFPGSEIGLTIKPMQTFLKRLEAKLKERQSNFTSRPLRIVVVGGGAAGIELTFCLPRFVERMIGERVPVEFCIIESGTQILAGMPRRTRALASRELSKRNVELKLNSRVESVIGNRIVLDNREECSADLLIWAISATAHDLLSNFDLPRDDRGFLLTRDTLQSVGSDRVFVVGDAGTIQNTNLPKAGVYAVRQGPVLWENLRLLLRGASLKRWRPQNRFLTLINSGDGRAIATYYGLSAHAKWCWRLKDWIDSRFMNKYQGYQPPRNMSNQPETVEDDKLPMQCGGCGCKASASLLAHSLPAIDNPQTEHVLLGINPPDDVALVEHGEGNAVAVTTDFFSAFIDDPYLLGRVAALNALSDLYAKGVKPRAALSIAVLPPGPLPQQEKLLDDLLAGATREFKDPGVPIVGGHTISGPKLIYGFTLLGDAVAENVMSKTTPSEGDCLVLTKPLGIGVLLAAHMRAACRSDWWEALFHTMLQSNQPAALSAQRVGASAATDVTGFGLAGHLLEMLATKNLSAEISLGSVPLLPGVAELLHQGIESTLAPSNRESFNSIEAPIHLSARPESSALFDPQTSGGLLLAIEEQRAEELLAACGPTAVLIGSIVESDKKGAKLRLTC
ncbi:MAG: selenide, water dikinase SelD [Planctomycetes bacterium]|nr:selenide, water dikinase SelD [Planctomycetota bacterium]